LKQTICRELILFLKFLFFKFKQNTIHLSHSIFNKLFLFFYNFILFFIYIFKNACIFNNFILLIFTLNLVLVRKFVLYYNPQITKARKYFNTYITYIYKSNITLNSGLSMLVGISEAICLLFFNISFIFFFNSLIYFNNLLFYYSFYTIKVNSLKLCKLLSKNFSMLPDKQSKETIFNQWLAGIIDGDGCFQLSKKGYASLEIVMEIRDKHCLYLIKQKFGGSIKLRSGVNWLRYRIHNKKGLLNLINAINGEIRNPIRLLQLNKICDNYNISLIQPIPLTYNNGWFAGFFDSDGSVYLNLLSSQMLITASQKNKFLLDMLVELYGGTVYIQKESFKWVVFKKAEINNLLNYFILCPSRSAKHNRLKSISRYYELRELKAHLASENSILGKAWKKFLLKWSKFEK